MYEPESELALLANVRAYLCGAEGPDFKIPTSAVDKVLDRWNEQQAREIGDAATEPRPDS